MPAVVQKLGKEWFNELPEEDQGILAAQLAALCEPLEEEGTLRGLLDETDSYTITYEGRTPVGFTIGDLTCPKKAGTSDEGGRRRRRRGSRGSRVKKQTRRTKRNRRHTVRR